MESPSDAEGPDLSEEFAQIGLGIWYRNSLKPPKKNPTILKKIAQENPSLSRLLLKHLKAYPDQQRQAIADKLKTGGDDFSSAWLELRCCLILNQLSVQNLEIEREITEGTSQGRKPDFWGRFSNDLWVVECCRPEANKDAIAVFESCVFLIELVSKTLLPGYNLVLASAASGSRQDAYLKVRPHDPKKPLKDWIERINSRIQRGERQFTVRYEAILLTENGAEITRHFEYGVDPYSDPQAPSTLSYSIPADDDHVEAYCQAIRNKRRQVRVPEPVILCLAPHSLHSTQEQFEEAVTKVVAATPPNPDKPSTFAGFLTLKPNGLLSFAPPILYQHPRANVTWPSEFERLERRVWEQDRWRSIPSNGQVDWQSLDLG